MQLVIKNGLVVASHEDWQVLDGLYPGCEIVPWDQALPADPMGLPPDPRDAGIPVDVTRKRKVALLLTQKAVALAKGYDTGLGFSIGVADTDQHTFASYKVFLDAQQRSIDALVVVGDVHGEPYSITVQQFHKMIVAYGVYCESLYQQFAIAHSHLMRAMTVEEVDAV